MLSTTTNTPSTKGADAAAKVTPTAYEKSPWGKRSKEFAATVEQYKSAGYDALILREHPLVAHLEVDSEEVEDMSEDEIDQVLSSLTPEQVDAHFQCAILPTAIADLASKYCKDIQYADPRNQRGDMFLMMNTYSSFCMYPVIEKQLRTASRAINKASKELQTLEKAGKDTAGCAKNALIKTMAALMACHDIDHWRLDTESPEKCDSIALKLSKFLSKLLEFTDAELGLIDPYARRTLLNYFSDVRDDFENIEWMNETINFKTDQNGQGMGRPEEGFDEPPRKRAAVGRRR